MTSDDLKAVLLKRRIVQIRGPINPTTYTTIVNDLLGLNAKSPAALRVLIDSRGGDVELALAIYDLIKSLRCKSIGLVTGECSSSALIVLQACTRRLAFTHAQFMFHSPRTTHTFQIDSQIKDAVQSWAKQSLRLPQAMRSILLKRSGMKQSDLRKLEKIGDTLNLTVGAATMQKYGIIDRICEKLTDSA